MGSGREKFAHGSADDGKVHERCGKPWKDHRVILLDGWLETPVCEDEWESGRFSDSGTDT